MAQSSPETTAAALLAGYLHAAGVRHVFGYPGESVIDFMEAARHRDIAVVCAVRMDGMDLVALAAAMDCDGTRADSPAALEKALSGLAARSRPLIVEARVDPAQYEAQF
jgi:thiamine pyrophosphate-dependent acetolactate synthase large subunit-like protein